jgi:hypothetical protein
MDSQLEGLIMTRKTTHLTLMAAVASLALLTVGCGSQQRSADASAAMPVEAYAGMSLAAGDGLGTQVFADDGAGATRFAMLRQVDDAIALAEAKEAAGEYDAWYASFIRPGEEGHDGTAIAGVEVPADE